MEALRSEDTSRPRLSPASKAAGGGLLLAVVFIMALFLLMSLTTFDTWGAMIVGPVLFLISLPILSRQAAREGDRSIYRLLVFALVLKFGAAILGNYVAYSVYGGQVDLAGYHRVGVQLAEHFRAGNFHTGLKGVTGSNFPILLNGIIYAIIGPTKLGGFIVQSWLGFWGLYLFYRAFTIAVPEGRSRSYARLVFFLPSQIFWSSYMGKDPWMVLALGVTAYGAARMLSGRTWRGLFAAGLGMWMASLVRPHVAGIAGLGLAAAFLIRRPRVELRQLAPVAKGLALVVIAALAVVLVAKTQSYLKNQGIDTSKGVTSALEQAGVGGESGGSEFKAQVVRSPAQYPAAAVTVLFRPFLFEVNSVFSVLAGVEGTFLILLTILRLGWIREGFRQVRRRPYVLFAISYVAVFVFAFSSFANFGLLARQRVQLVPFYLVLLAIPPTRLQNR